MTRWMTADEAFFCRFVCFSECYFNTSTNTNIHIHTVYTLFITLDRFSFVWLVQRQCNIASTPLACCLSHSLVACLLQHRLNYVLCLCIVRIVFATRFVVSLFRRCAIVHACTLCESILQSRRSILLHVCRSI